MRTALLVLLVVGVAAADPVVVAKPDAFPTLVNPDCSHCRDEAKRRAADLRDDDRVLCWTRGYSDGGAIPYRFFLNPYRVISDTYGVFVLDAEAGYARGFAPSLDFRFHGWRDGVMVMKHKDGTLYSCLSGRAFDGPNKGQRLKAVPTLTSTWGTWLRTYPQAVAYHMFDKYQAVELPAKANEDSLKSRGTADPRLPADAPVLGVFADDKARAYPVEAIAKAGLLVDGERVVLWQPTTKTAAAYTPLASPPKKGQGEPRKVTLSKDAKNADAPFTDKETGSRWDVAGRAVEGELKGWTLTWLDGVQVKWFAWAAEYPETDLYAVDDKAVPPKPEEKMREVAGSAEVLFAVPKKWALVKSIDAAKRAVTLLLDGEMEPTTWPLTDDAEVKVHGWWGRLDQFKAGDRVWCWFQVDRKKKPTAILMLADELSEQDVHGAVTAVAADEFEKLRQAQKSALAGRWEKEGLPGTVTFAHISGEVDYLLDHEAMRWGRSLKVGDKVKLADEPPIQAVVKGVTPWRERTQVRLVIKGLEIADLKVGKRLPLLMTPPSAEVQASPLPPDVDLPRTKEERVEWFLASIYCTCKVKGDRCTGMFYTLASCNPNGCGLPNGMRQYVGKKIDQGQTDRQIFEEMMKTYGPELTRPHLLK